MLDQIKRGSSKKEKTMKEKIKTVLVIIGIVWMLATITMAIIEEPDIFGPPQEHKCVHTHCTFLGCYNK